MLRNGGEIGDQIGLRAGCFTLTKLSRALSMALITSNTDRSAEVRHPIDELRRFKTIMGNA